VDGRRAWDIEARQWQILNMLRKHKRPGFEDQNPVAVCTVALKQVFSQRGAKRPAANHYNIEGTSVGTQSGIRALQSLF